MSDSLMAAQPRKLEASKPNPSSNEPSESWLIGKVRWCQEPGKSVNLTETNLAPSSEAYFKAVLAFMFSPDCCRECGGCEPRCGSCQSGLVFGQRVLCESWRRSYRDGALKKFAL